MVSPQEATFINMLAVLFIGLKLAHIIDWSWWWVLSPIWGVVTIAFISALFTAAKEKK